MKIKKGDMVVVISGDEAAQAPRRVSEVLEGGMKVVVEGVNVVQRHVKRGHPKSPQGGRLRFEKAIFASNVMFYCDGCKKPTRIGFRMAADGSKERFCKKCNTSAGRVSPPRG
jgi:large subunit ribosomal protein L24